MREILFKAKRKNWQELPKEQWWIEGYLVKKKCGRYTTIGYEEYEAYVIVSEFSDGGMQFCYIDENTLCQFTGLTDKKGNRIWENDIVSEDWDAYEGVIRFGEFDTQTLKNIGFNIEWEKEVSYRQDLLYWAEKVEVVGNIFDNSERLEGGAV